MTRASNLLGENGCKDLGLLRKVIAREGTSWTKKALGERDICTKFITPALADAGWDVQRQVREEVTFTKGRVIVRGRLHSRGQARRADYVLYHQPNLPLAVIEARLALRHGSGLRWRACQICYWSLAAFFTTEPTVRS